MKFNTSPKVQELVRDLGINIIGFHEYRLEYESETKGIGLYHSGFDVIAMLEHELTTTMANETCLHELIHWTGHSSRLARRKVVFGELAFSSTCHESERLLDSIDWECEAVSEEIVAQFGMLLLAYRLDLPDIEYYEDICESYVREWLCVGYADLERCIELAMEACDFILSRAESIAA